MTFPKPRVELETVTAVPHGATHDPSIIDFSSSVITLDLPLETLFRKTQIFCYPDSDSADFCKAVATSSNCTVANVTPGNGASEILWMVGLAFLSSSSRVGMLSPTFGEYERICRIMGASVRPLQLSSREDFTTTSEAINSFIKQEKVSAFFLCNPNNPTGQTLSAAALHLLFTAHPETLFVVDLAYADYTDLSLDYSILASIPNTIFVHSLTKAFGIAGLRSGYALAHPNLTNALFKVKPPWNMNALAQSVSTFLMEQRSSFLANAKACQRHAAELAAKIQHLGLRVVPSTTDYFMVDVGDARACKERLLKEGFLVRELASLGQPRFIRINVSRPNHIQSFYDTFSRVIKNPIPSAPDSNP